MAALVAGLGWLAVGPGRFPWRVTGLTRQASPRPWGPGHSVRRAGPRRSVGSVRSARRPQPALGTARRPRAVDRAGSVDEVAVAADLLAVATAAGCSVHEAVLGAGGACGPGAPLAEAAAALRHGRSLDEVLDRLARHPPSGWHTLATTLGVSAASGAPATGVLRRLATQERTRARRDRERRARRLPVVLLLPLVGLVLPSFVLVTLVPVALSGAASLQLPPTEATPESQEEP